MELRALIAQHLLATQGYYCGALDGLWGPLSRDAAARWQAAHPETDPEPAPKSDRHGPVPTPYSLALTHLGQKEIPGVKNNPLILRWLRRLASWINEEETPWCSAFVNAMAAEAGYESSGKLNARSWLDVGEPVHIRNARQGDVVIYWRVEKNGWEGHVGFVHDIDLPRGLIRTLGGNQADSVSIATYSTTQVLGFRRLRSLDSLQGKSSAVL